MTIGGALRRYPIVALLPVVALTAAGAAIGVARPPVYTASSQIQVGAPDINSQATPGYVQAEQTLASAYSREVTSQYVYNPVARQLGVSPASVAARLSSSAVPTSPTFSINGTGDSPAQAIRMTNVATAALRQAINVVDQGETASGGLLARYRSAQENANRLAAHSSSMHANGASSAISATPAGSSSAPVTTSTISGHATKRQLSAQLDAQVAQLQAQSLAQQYTAASTSSRGAIIQVLNPAASATSDRSSVAERYGIVGAVAGIIIGAALTLLLASVRSKRRGRLAW